MIFDRDIENVFERYKIFVLNYQIIGFMMLKDYLFKLKKDELYEKIVIELKNVDDDYDNWLRFYGKFKQDLIEQFGEFSFICDKNGEIILVTFICDKFNELMVVNILILYEFVFYVEIKLKIIFEEREMFLLFGCFVIFLKVKELKDLLIEYKQL